MAMDPSSNDPGLAALERAFARMPPELVTGPDPVAAAVLEVMRRARLVRQVTICVSGAVGVGIFAAAVSMLSVAPGWHPLARALAELAERAPLVARASTTLVCAAAAVAAALTILGGLRALRDT